MDYEMRRTFPIRFDGMDASNESIDMRLFGQSMVGLSRILKNSAHFAIRHEYAERQSKSHIQIMARPPRDGCILLEAVAIAQTQAPLLQPLVEAVTWQLITTLTGTIFIKRSGRDKELGKSLDIIDKLVEQQGVSSKADKEIINKLLDANQAAVKAALSPVGRSCASLQVGEIGAGGQMIDFATADAIRSKEDLEVGDAKTFRGLIDSITKHTNACKIALEDSPGRFTAGQITDPEILKKENIYTLALHQESLIEFTAKPLRTKEDGVLKRLYISNANIIDDSR